jgi:hypothetical protein
MEFIDQILIMQRSQDLTPPFDKHIRQSTPAQFLQQPAQVDSA